MLGALARDRPPPHRRLGAVGSRCPPGPGSGETGISQRRKAAQRKIVLRDPKHAVGTTIVARQPADELLGCGRRNKQLTVLGCHPFALKRPQCLRQLVFIAKWVGATVRCAQSRVRRDSRHARCATRRGSRTTATDRETQAHQDPPRLMGREVGSVQTGDKSDHLLRRIATAADHHIVAGHRLWKYTSNGLFDALSTQLKRLLRNRE
jgi:hypothetical protein